MTQKYSVAPVDALPSATDNMPSSPRASSSDDIFTGLPRSADSIQLDALAVEAAIRGCTIRQEGRGCCCGGPCTGDAGAAPTTAACVLSEAGISLEMLSRTERIVFLQLASGLRVAEIARNLSRSPKTISTQKMSVMRKLGVGTDFELHRMIARLQLDDGSAEHPLQNACRQSYRRIV